MIKKDLDNLKLDLKINGIMKKYQTSAYQIFSQYIVNISREYYKPAHCMLFKIHTWGGGWAETFRNVIGEIISLSTEQQKQNNDIFVYHLNGMQQVRFEIGIKNPKLDNNLIGKYLLSMFSSNKNLKLINKESYMEVFDNNCLYRDEKK